MKQINFPTKIMENPLKINGWTPKRHESGGLVHHDLPICPFPGEGTDHPSHAAHAHAPFDSLSPKSCPGSDAAKKKVGNSKTSLKHPIHNSHIKCVYIYIYI